jgi:hypothetical protein
VVLKKESKPETNLNPSLTFLLPVQFCAKGSVSCLRVVGRAERCIEQSQHLFIFSLLPRAGQKPGKNSWLSACDCETDVCVCVCACVRMGAKHL